MGIDIFFDGVLSFGAIEDDEIKVIEVMKHYIPPTICGNYDTDEIYFMTTKSYWDMEVINNNFTLSALFFFHGLMIKYDFREISIC